MSKSEVTPAGRKALSAVLCLGVGLTALSAAAPALAQEQEAAEETRTMQTVTITATKREQTLQDVPIAVSVVDDTTIERAAIVDLNDLQSIIPSLRVGQLQSSANTNFVIRGFGNGANNAGIEPSVGVFIDGVYRSRSASQISDLPNIERVEVLRGPQSTLFGKNASAGVISVVTKKPQYEFGGVVDGTISNENGYRANGYVTGPLAENLAGAVGVTYNKRDGYVEDIGTGTETNERNRWGIRGDLLFEPDVNTSFRLMADYDQIDELCCAAANVVNGPTGAIVQAIGGQIVPEDPYSYRVAYNLPSTNKVDNGGLSLQADFDFEKVRLTSITAYRMSRLETNQDSDFTGADLLGENSNKTDIDTFTQEFRLTSTDGERLDWMVGGFYFDEKVDIQNALLYGTDYRAYANALAGGLNPNTGVITDILAGLESALGLPVGTTLAQAGQGFRDDAGQDNTAWSLFGTVDYRLTDRLTATIGLNYTEDKKDARNSIQATDVLSSLDFVAIGFAQTMAGFGVNAQNPAQVAAFAQANPAAFAAIQAAVQNPAQNPLLALQPLQFLPPFLGFPNAVEDGRSKDSATTYTLRLAYDVNDNLNTYVSYATGFKATSWNLSRDSRPFASDFIPGSPVTSPPSSPIRDAGLALPNLTTGSRYAGPEDSTVFEVGLKGVYSNVAFNLAYFDQTIEGFQSNVFTGTGFALANAGKQSNKGLEFDVTWNPISNLQLMVAGTLQDPVYDSFPNSASGDLSGEKVYGIPEVATSTAATYFFDVAGWDAYVRGDWQYESAVDHFDSDAEQAAFGEQKKVNTFNASTGFTNESGLGVTLWVRNVFNDEYITTAFPAVAQAGSYMGYPVAPRSYGVTLRKTF
ncbi:outer membrane receptor (OMR) family protein [Hyphomonas polymorpha PS728]|uniref:Outer membrane receptor (OMR) family protein n=1 Tax=Hyphomonas polymorpha PS728 TaxID=1280954 RepID=A0A062VB31_9PROT|nr:TonB-dependent receptor [Hyphomonas polymorpha]KCZ97417.1 outer membrane receptor (OMR) family protein [Hyphomonas polymorpha PS728]